MGCDIHGWVEIKQNDKWVAIAKLKDDSRNYARFCMLANVRCPLDSELSDENEPKGLPGDISDTAKFWLDYWRRWLYFTKQRTYLITAYTLHSA